MKAAQRRKNIVLRRSLQHLYLYVTSTAQAGYFLSFVTATARLLADFFFFSSVSITMSLLGPETVWGIGTGSNACHWMRLIEISAQRACSFLIWIAYEVSLGHTVRYVFISENSALESVHT